MRSTFSFEARYGPVAAPAVRSAIFVLAAGALLSTAMLRPDPAKAEIPHVDLATDDAGNFLVVAGVGGAVVGLAPSGPGEFFEPFLVNEPAEQAVTQPAVAFLGEDGELRDFVVVWRESFFPGDETAAAIRGRILSYDFVQGVDDPREEFTIAAGGSDRRRDPDVASLGDGSFVAVWRDKFRVFTGDQTIMASRVRDGDVPSLPLPPLTLTTSIPAEMSVPRVALAGDGTALVAWQQDDGVRAAAVAPDDRVRLIDEVALLSAGTQARPSIAALGPAPADFVAVWDSAPPGGDAGIFSRRFHDSESGAMGGAEVQVNSRVLGDQRGADVAADPEGNTVVVWLDAETNAIRGQRLSAGNVYVEGEIEVSEDLGGAAPFGRPRVALLADGRFLAAWADAQGTVYVREGAPSQVYLDCVAGDSTLCPQSGRFRVDVAWRAPGGERRSATAVPLSDAAGYFYFADSENVELVVKVLQACDREAPCYWIFAGGMTDLEVELRVRDAGSGLAATYRNPAGMPFQPILDTASFARDRLLTAGAKAAPARASERGGALRLAATSAAKDGGCGGAPDALCLGRGRFRVEVGWAAPGGVAGRGRGTRLTRDAGFFSFFDPGNVETFFKVLDGCAVNGHYWLFGAGLTDLEVETRVIDVATGATATYLNPQGAPFQSILDTTAFATCP